MTDIELHLKRWLAAGVLDATAAARIRVYEQDHAGRAGLRWQGLVALTLGAILLACGVALFVSAHWDQMSPGARFALIMATVAALHLAGAWTRFSSKRISTTLHAVGTASIGPAIALVGQIFHLQEHWPSAILLWTLCAVAGWVLLHDQLQKAFALLLFPAWIFCEIERAAENRIGQEAYLGRFLVLWATLYFVLFLGSRRKVLREILLSASALGLIAGTCFLLAGWESNSAQQSFLSFGTRVGAWIAMGLLPFSIALFKGRKGLLPMIVALVYALALPWCQRLWTVSISWGNTRATYTQHAPNLAAHLLVAFFAVYLCWWGIHQRSRRLVNFGTLCFALSVGWFYFSNLYDALGRSLGLIGLGVLFLAGGWALERFRRRMLAGMNATVEEAQ